MDTNFAGEEKDMGAEIIPYHKKRERSVVDWDWMQCVLDPQSVDVPVMGTVAAGQPIEAIPWHQTVAIPKDLVGRFETYALRVEGDSMKDENIQDGDFIIIEAKQTAENGETVVAIINNEEVTLKKFYVEPDHIRLQPANKNMAPILLYNHQVKVLGVVCAVIRKYRFH
jgi:repressor LexA